MSWLKPTPDEQRIAGEVVARLYAIRTHSFDDTDFCTACGQSYGHICNTMIECFGQPNIIAISHLRRAPVEDEEWREKVDDTRVTRGSGNVFKDLNVQPPAVDRKTRARLGMTDDDVRRMRAMRWDDETDGPTAA